VRVTQLSAEVSYLCLYSANEFNGARLDSNMHALNVTVTADALLVSRIIHCSCPDSPHTAACVKL